MADLVQIKGLKELELMFNGISTEAPKAMARAINNTFTPTRKKASEEIRKEYNVLAKEAKDSFKWPPYKANKNNLTGKLIAKGYPLPFIRPEGTYRFGGAERRKGFAFTIKKAGRGRGGGGRKHLTTAFIGTSKKGKKHFYVFSEKTGLKTLYSARVTDILSNEEVMKPILEFASETMEKKLDAAVKAILKGY